MSLPRYLYIPFGIQLGLEVISRLAAENFAIGLGSMIVTLGLCVYVGAQGVLVRRTVLSSALWTVPLTLLGFINGSLGFALLLAGYDRAVYPGFVLSSVQFCIAGVVAGVMGGLGGRFAARAKRPVN